MTTAPDETSPPLVEETPSRFAEPVPRKTWAVGVVFGICVTLLGLLLLWAAAGADYAALRGAPWENAVILFETPAGVSAAEILPAQVRRVERDEILRSDYLLKVLGTLFRWDRFEETVRLTDPEWVIAMDLPAHKVAPLLNSGRLPEPGQPEVLAGDLARMEPFQVDGRTFEVVGTLKRSASVFLFAYLLPHGADFAEHFTPERGAKEGLLLEDASRLFQEDLLPDLYPKPVLKESEPTSDTPKKRPEVPEAEAPLVLPNYLGGIMRSPDTVALSTLLGMMLIAGGGACFYFYLFRRLYAGKGVLARPFFAEVLKRPVLFWTMHLFFYGVFFSIMWRAMDNPLLAYRTKLYIEMVFSQGGLGHVGAAYDSGSIAHAAWMTFYNNFIEQTLLLTFLISLVPIPLGLIKNLLSFLLVGGAISPIWAGSAATLTVHALTMILELEAYILACFAITAWPLTLISGIRSKQCLKGLKSGLTMLLSAVVVTGIILALAALYEALTLIHLL